tara:strand:- start:315 stop:1949 length:1635 start_codon:yes stop_codon:yes gene_type:complete
MGQLRLILRLLVIQKTLFRYGLEDVVRETHLFRSVGWIYRFIPRGPYPESLGARIRLALEELGPIFVKFGQAVSTRRDLLPVDIADELAKLQDQVPPFDSIEALNILSSEFGKKAEEIFADFEQIPLAAASVAQVHSATLHTGESVVVKILRPDARLSIERDLKVLYAIAKLAERYWSDGHRLRPVEVIKEFEKTILKELDLLREAANATQLKKNFKDSKKLYVPEIYWDYCRKNILTMEHVKGVPISDVKALRDAGTNIKRLAENGVEIFFTQVFQHNFFHADMHPGNIFVDISNPENPRYIAIDFGIVGSLSPSNQHYLAGNFLAFFKQDYNRVAQLHVDSGWVPSSTHIAELEASIRAVCEPIFNKPLKDISFGLVLLRLFDTARKFDMEVQPQLVLLQKTLLNVEGLGRELYPDLDLWSTAQPVLQEWMKQRTDPRAHVKRFIQNWPQISEDLVQLPDAIHQIIKNILEEAREEKPHKNSSKKKSQQNIFIERISILPGMFLIVVGALWMGTEIIPVWPAWYITGLGIVWAFLANHSKNS